MVMFETPDSKYLGMKRKPDAARGWRREERKFETLTQLGSFSGLGKFPAAFGRVIEDLSFSFFVLLPSESRTHLASLRVQPAVLRFHRNSYFIVPLWLRFKFLVWHDTLAHIQLVLHQNYVSLQWFVPNGLCLLEKNLAQTLDCGLLGLTG